MESIVATFIHEIRKTLRGDPHTFTEIRYMIEEARIEEMPLFDVLQQHHGFLNESVAVLTDRESTVSEKQIHVDRFLRLLEMHSRAEQETLYRSLSRHHLSEVLREAQIGQDEHAVVERLASELSECRFLTNWTPGIDAKVQVLTAVFTNHLDEEELVMFPLAKKSLLPKEMQVLAGDYLDLCEFYLDGDSRPLQPQPIAWATI